MSPAAPVSVSPAAGPPWDDVLSSAPISPSGWFDGLSPASAPPSSTKGSSPDPASEPAAARSAATDLASTGPAAASPVEASPVEAGPVEAGPVEAGPVEAGPVEAATPKATTTPAEPGGTAPTSDEPAAATGGTTPSAPVERGSNADASAAPEPSSADPGEAGDDDDDDAHGLGWLLSMSGLGAVTPERDPTPVSTAPTGLAGKTNDTADAPVGATPASANPVSSTPVSSAPASSTPVSSAPATADPISSTPISSTPVSAAPATADPISSTPVSAAPVTADPVSSTPVSSTPVSAVPVSAVPTSGAAPKPDWFSPPTETSLVIPDGETPEQQPTDSDPTATEQQPAPEEEAAEHRSESAPLAAGQSAAEQSAAEQSATAEALAEQPEPEQPAAKPVQADLAHANPPQVKLPASEPASDEKATTTTGAEPAAGEAEPARAEAVEVKPAATKPTAPETATAGSPAPEPVEAQPEPTAPKPVTATPTATESAPTKPAPADRKAAESTPAKADPTKADATKADPTAEQAGADTASADTEAGGEEHTPTAAEPRTGKGALLRTPSAQLPALSVPPPPEPVLEPERPLVDPEQVLAAYPWRFDPITLRELVDDPGQLRAVRDRLTDKLEYAERDAVRARLLSLRAVVSRVLGDLGRALADGREALRHAEATGELRRTSIVQARLAHVQQWRGDFAEADRLYEEANSVELPDRLRAEMHVHAGKSCYEQGRYLEACNHFEAALELRRVEDPGLVARTEAALDAVVARVKETGWGPYPRSREEILQQSRPPHPAVDYETGWMGYADNNGDVVIVERYADAQPFHEGAAWVRRPNFSAWELIDETGTLLIDASSGYVQVGPFGDGLAWVSRDVSGGWFAVDWHNRVIVPGGFEDVRPFRQGIAIVRRGGWGAIDRHGRGVVQPRYRGFATELTAGGPVPGFTGDGLAVVDAGDLLGVVDRTGQVLVPPVYPRLLIHPVAFIVGDRDGRWGALDRRGAPILDVTYRKPADVVDEIERLLTDTRPVL